MDDIDDIRDYYDAGWDSEDNRLERHQLERDITWRYLETYLPLQGYILEVGSATGQYTLELARRGYTIMAVDLAPALVASAKERATEEGLDDRIEFRVGDARFLSGVPDESFDAALVMGPLYHLVLQDERLMTLKRVFQSLKVNGILFSSLLSRFGVLGDVLKNIPTWIEDENDVSSLIEEGKRPDDSPKGGFRGYFATLSEISPLHEEAGFRKLTIAGLEPAISADDENYNRLDGERRRLWLDLLFKISAEPSTVASSRHLMYVGRKPPSKRKPAEPI
jgi:S-adenosylmethionine-dependent methyltransferase